MRRLALFIGVIFCAVVALSVFRGDQFVARAQKKPTATPTNIGVARDSGSKLSYSAAIPALSSVDEKQTAGVITAVAGQFDADGVEDVVSVDANGQLALMRGRVGTHFQHLKRGSDDAPFLGSDISYQLPIVPDEIFSGDFNADGHTDILAAKTGDDALYLVPGDGRGGFLPWVKEYVGGSVTACTTGEIGRPDGQADVAVSFAAEGKSYVGVFEHPEGAFSHRPEVFSLPMPAASIAIGQLDGDPYSDVAIGCGETLTVIHERGQAYPFDMLPDAKIQRPAAAVRTMDLGFTVRSLVAAEMDGTRGEGLALLGTDGGLRYFKADRSVLRPKVRPRAKTWLHSVGFVPAGVDASKLVASDQPVPQTEADADTAGLLMANTDDVRSLGISKIIENKTLAAAAERAKTPAAKLAADDAAKVEKQAQMTTERKRLFEAGLASKPIEFASWKMEMLVMDSQLAAAATSGNATLVRARVSSSGVDDLLIADPAAGSVTAVARLQGPDEKLVASSAQVERIDTGAWTSALVPMRLNVDGRSDLVVFNAGSTQASVIMSDPTAVYTVNTTDDVGGGNCQNDGQPCGIRRALFWANFVPGSMIAFNIPGEGVHTIHLNSALPDLHEVAIDGTTQPGYIDKPLIELKGDLLAGGAVEGFRVTRSNTVIRGMAINEMPGISDGGSIVSGSGIVLLTYIGDPIVTNVTIESNFLGTDALGTSAFGNEGNGVQIYNADGNLIGGTIRQSRNILSGNGKYSEQKRGVGFAITGGNYNRVYGNYVGTDVTGMLRLGNSDGAFVTGVGNQIGSDDPGTGNVISGNGTPPNEFGHCVGAGLAIFQLYDVETAAPLTNGTTVRGNLVGTNASGTAAVYNCTQGLSSSGNLNTSIGSITQGGRNTVSGNKYDGIWCGFNDSAFFPVSGNCSIVGNNIGTNVTGNAAIPNSGENTCVGFCLVTETVWLPTSGIDFAVLGSPGGTTPGGACTGFCNLISGNYGPYLDGGGFQKSGTGFGLIINNYIGTNAAGDSALPNFSGGIAYYGSALIGVTFGDGQGGFIPGGNLISGNNAQGVGMTSIDGGGLFWIKGNTFGLSSDGLSAIPNGIGGTESAAISVRAQGGTSLQIGGTNTFDRNYLTYETSDGMANRGHGIYSFANTASIIAISGNSIGVDPHGNPAPNSGDGIDAQGTGHTIIGGGGLGGDNIIANNGRSGVFIYSYAGTFSSSDATGVTVRQNVIRNNGALGIDLTNVFGGGAAIPDGVTPNDCQDLDTGANGLQNYPELYAPVQNQDGTLRIDTTLKSLPNRQFTIDYYLNDQADPTNYGEGQTWLGTGTMITSSNSFASSSFNTTQQLPTTAIITATATDQDGNTSEFSCAAGVCTANQNFEERVREAPDAAFCIQPIVVTTTGDESDLDGENPIQNRDGLCDVDAATPGEQCTLRAAIQEANARPGFDLINFAIPGAGVQTITVPFGQPLLPKIREKVEINGSSQSDGNGHPFIQISGQIQGDQAPLIGLQVATSDAVVRGLAVNRFTNNIAIGDTSGTFSNNSIESCYIGINADGTNDATGGSEAGISMGGNATYTNNRIGIGTYGGNVISNNQVGILMGGASVSNNVVAGNRIGTDPTGTTAIPNISGIILGSFAHDNTIGGDLNSDRNVISGNLQDGISVGTDAKNNKIQGNYIGTRSDGEFALPNGVSGVKLITRANGNIIGGPGAYGNIISGNGGVLDPNVGFQIAMDASTFSNQVFGNVIGMKRSGTQGLGGIVGIGITGSRNIIGGQQSAPNIIGSQKIGVSISSDGASGALQNTISYNRIGVDANNGPIANMIGVALDGETTSTSIANNTISGNTAYGVLVRGSSTGTPSNNTIGQNKIGTDSDGRNAAPNGAGVVLYRATGNTVAQNVISGNALFGVFIGEDFDQAAPTLAERAGDIHRFMRPNGSTTFTSDNTVKSNRIGTNATGDSPLPNGYTGVQVGENARNNVIGGNRRSGDGNYIAGHTVGGPRAGVYIGSIFVDPTDQRLPRDNKIQGNFIGWGVNFTEIGNGTGIYISGAANNVIGADPECQAPDCAESDYGNYIGNSMFGAGITFDGEGTIDNNVRGNFIGVSNNFTLGGTNAVDGILYKATNHNMVSDNIIASSGRDGVRVEGHRSFTLEDNYIDGNGGNGITVAADQTQGQRPQKVRKRTDRPEDIFDVILRGNIVGKIATNGISSITGNGGIGIEVLNTANVLIGKSLSGRKPMVLKSGGAGIKIVGTASTGVEVSDAVIGTDETGASGVGNNGDGIRIEGASGNTIGGVSAGNVVAGNAGDGISIENANATSILGNQVGVVPLQTTVKLPNQKNGVAIRNGSNSFLGGISPAVTNIVSGNLENGVLISGVNAQVNRIMRNVLGTDLANDPGLGNSQNGVRITNGAHNNVIGGDQPDFGNTITGNGGDGIQVDDENLDNLHLRRTSGPHPRGDAPFSSINNQFVNNTIFGNTKFGIAFGTDDLITNDDGDFDTGPNQLQNYPTIEEVSVSGGQVHFAYKVQSDPSGGANYGVDGLTIQFFLADTSGQGQTLIGTDMWTVEKYGSGLQSVRVTYDLPAGTNGSLVRVTGTATDADGNTSQFAPVPAITTAASVAVSGRVTTADGLPIRSARIGLQSETGMSTVLTNAFGYYKFEKVGSGRTYILSARHKTYSFGPPRVVRVIDQLVDLNFIASP